MSEKCKWLHEQLETIVFPFLCIDGIPPNGIYFIYERGEIWDHGGIKPRIVRVGTHRVNGSLPNRISEHFLVFEEKLDFWNQGRKPSDRSIFRKNIGRAILNQHNDPYIQIWNIDFTNKINREQFGNLRDIEKEKEIEREITRRLRKYFSFRFLIINNERERQELEKHLIGTLASCQRCGKSEAWFGNHSPIEKIRGSGLWQVQHLKAPEISDQEMENMELAVRKTQNWLGIKFDKSH